MNKSLSPKQQKFDYVLNKVLQLFVLADTGFKCFPEKDVTNECHNA